MASFVNCPLKAKLPLRLKALSRLFCVRIKSTPAAIWCLPRIRSRSSASWYVLRSKMPGDAPVLNAPLTDISMPDGS